MLISRTPFRISFLGGGTDFERYFKEHGGSVLSTTIDKFCYITIRKMPTLFEYRNQLTYSKIERFNDPDEVEHPVVREAMKYLEIDRIQITYDADLPARAGLGASSSFSVGLLNSLHHFKNEKLDKMALAKESIFLEQELCQESGGMQDQIAVCFGGLNRINFSADGYEVCPLQITAQRKEFFNSRLMLFFTGFTRLSSEIALDQSQNIPERLAQLHEMKALVDEGEKILTGSGDLRDFGELLNVTWKLKRTLSGKIATDFIDNAYARAMEAGAIGGKLLGAGGGGFMLFYVEPDKRESVKAALSELLYVPFRFEEEGTTIIYKGEKENKEEKEEIEERNGKMEGSDDE
ncbi:MAG TPA: kinase [Clostridia bacterium]|nr:kinase [Clostridia bacterium]